MSLERSMLDLNFETICKCSGSAHVEIIIPKDSNAKNEIFSKISPQKSTSLQIMNLKLTFFIIIIKLSFESPHSNF